MTTSLHEALWCAADLQSDDISRASSQELRELGENARELLQQRDTAVKHVAHLRVHLRRLILALSDIVGQEKPNRYGYDAAHVALQDEWRTNARRVLKEAKELS